MPNLLTLITGRICHLPNLPDLPTKIPLLILPNHTTQRPDRRELLGPLIRFLKYLGLGIMLGGRKRQRRGLILILRILHGPCKGLDKLQLLPLFGRLRLKQMFEVVVTLLVLGLGHVDRVDEDFGVVHGAPADEAAVVAEGRELVLLDVAVHRLFYVEVAVGHAGVCETANKYIMMGYGQYQ